MFTYFALPISYVYTVFYTILQYHSQCRSDIARPYIYILLIPFLYLDLYVLGSCCGIVRYYLLDVTALSELETQAFRYTRNNLIIIIMI